MKGHADHGPRHRPDGIPALLYHATPKKNLASIIETGLDPYFRGSEGLGGVWFHHHPAELAEMGSTNTVVIEVDVEGLNVESWYDEGDEGGVWEYVTYDHVDPDRIIRVVAITPELMEELEDSGPDGPEPWEGGN